jgi:hypothetical protein
VVEERRLAEERIGIPRQAPSHTTAGIGTPQVRWREMHQSGRVSIICAMRCSPNAGSQVPAWMAATALPRRSPASIAMNHCGVARKSTGLWQRQQ